MGVYPDYPDNRLVVDGIDLTETFGMVMADGYTLDLPKPKTYTIDLLGGDGVIDLTEAITGDVTYDNRSQKFTFYVINLEDHETFEDLKTAVFNYLHGKDFDYTLSFDPGYTYHGRFTVSSASHTMYSSGILGAIQIDIDAEPYKSSGMVTYKLKGGTKRVEIDVINGRKRVIPIIEVKTAATIAYNGQQWNVEAGTHIIDDLLLESGKSTIYINTSPKFGDRTVAYWSKYSISSLMSKRIIDLFGDNTDTGGDAYVRFERFDL